MTNELDSYVKPFQELKIAIQHFLDTEDGVLRRIPNLQDKERAMVIFAAGRLLRQRRENKVSSINWRTSAKTPAEQETLKLLKYQLATFLERSESELDFLLRRVSELLLVSRL